MSGVKVIYKLKVIGECEPELSGTKVTFLPDKEIFEETIFDYDIKKSDSVRWHF